MIKVLRTFLVIALVILCILGTIYNRMRANEITSNINFAKTTYLNLQNEEKTLLLNLNEKYSAEDIKARAEALGMVKANASQVEYVDIKVNEDIVATPKNPDTIREAAFSFLNIFAHIN